MVVSAEEIATKVGVQILKKGGNAIDAAVAVGFALAVTYPNAGNIGGGGFLVAHLSNGKNIAIDFRETAPKLSSRDMYLDSAGNFIQAKSLEGGLSVGVPGTVAGLLHVLKKYGTKNIEQIIQPAINLAEMGFPLSKSNSKSLNDYRKDFKKFSSTKKIFIKEKPFEEGDIFYQKELATSLKKIKILGENGFYSGDVAENIVKSINENGGIFSLEDLKNYEVKERNVIKCNFKDYEVISMPPPSSGGIALTQILNMFELTMFQNSNLDSITYYHTLIEVLKLVYADRASHLGDPDFINIPMRKLISKEYAKSQFGRIKDNATPSHDITTFIYNPDSESEETTHYSVYDQFGNAVSVTYTLNGGYGSKLVAEGTGILLNNEMDDFSAKPGTPNQFGLIGSEANSIQPKKRMLSSMTPTIVLKNEKPFLIVGSPGGSTIITVVAQVLLNALYFNSNLNDAVNKPRIHHQWFPDQFDIEKEQLSDFVLKELERKGNKIGKTRLLGLVEAILIDNENNIIYAVSDKRGNGHAEGH
jgi:gamma-glutamyltranspeptidase/glutathione hydrolase